MAWIQAGIASGEIVYNVTGALVHFVEEDGAMLMLLVSPRIFRHFLEMQGETTDEPEDKLGSALQREFFKAGWHRAEPKRMNILFWTPFLRQRFKLGSTLWKEKR